MKKQLLSSALPLFFLILVAGTYAQNRDLVVTTKGDSIVCRIDSITEARIYFEMKSQSQWTHTHMELTDVDHYEKAAVKKGQYLYKPGTTIIKSVNKDEIRRNSVYIGISTINYSRRFGPKGRITLGGGLLAIGHPGVSLESTLSMGGAKHFIESGINGFCFFDEGAIALYAYGGQKKVGGSFRLGYRYQGPKGFLIRAAPQVSVFDGLVMLLPALSLGYSF